MTKEEQQALLKCGLFAGMTGQEAEQLLHCVGGGVLHYEKNTVLWHPGQQVDTCAVVLSGELRAETVTAGGGRAGGGAAAPQKLDTGRWWAIF